MRMGDARRLEVLERPQRLAAQRGHHAREHDHEAVAAGVHHAGLAQHRQQLGAALDRLLAGVDRALQQQRQHRVLLRRGPSRSVSRGCGHVRDLAWRPVRHLTHHGEDRPLGRPPHRAVGAVGGAGHGGADQHRVDQLAGARDQLLGGAADQLGEDHAGVAAGAQQRGARHGVDDLLAPDLVERPCVLREAVELVEHGAQRQRHVVPRVAVGDREDVQVVDLLAARFERAEGALDDGAEAEKARIGHGSAERSR